MYFVHLDILYKFYPSKSSSTNLLWGNEYRFASGLPPFFIVCLFKITRNMNTSSSLMVRILMNKVYTYIYIHIKGNHEAIANDVEDDI